jgi:hypothetical protein
MSYEMKAIAVHSIGNDYADAAKYAASQLHEFKLRTMKTWDVETIFEYEFEADDENCRDRMLEALNSHVRDAVMAAHIDRKAAQRDTEQD